MHVRTISWKYKSSFKKNENISYVNILCYFMKQIRIVYLLSFSFYLPHFTDDLRFHWVVENIYRCNNTNAFDQHS